MCHVGQMSAINLSALSSGTDRAIDLSRGRTGEEGEGNAWSNSLGQTVAWLIVASVRFCR